MKRRLMIARGLVHDPKVLILDEPTAGVDIEIRREMWEFLEKLNQSGTTIILTTHYLEEAEQLCNNMAIINKGEVIERGAVKDLLGKMDQETFIFDLEAPLPEKTEALVGQFGVRKVDDNTIEMIVKRGESINDAIIALNRLDIRVRSVRNKSNRLEEFFLQKINQNQSV
jgi:ABC-2 type transport system ATP-binding protein